MIHKNNYRATHRNAKQKQLPAYVHFVHQKLLDNRQLLSELNPKEKAKVDKKELLSRGFHAGYFTNIYQERNHLLLLLGAGHFAYGYCLILIVKLQPFVQEQFEQGLQDDEILYILNRYFL